MPMQDKGLAISRHLTMDGTCSSVPALEYPKMAAAGDQKLGK